MQHGIRAIAFDIDGTLYPNRRMRFHSLSFLMGHFSLVRAFARVRLDIRKVEDVRNFKVLQAEMLAKALGCPVGNAAWMLDALIYGKWERIFKKVKPYKGVEKTLKALKSRGYKLGALSDFPVGRKLEYFHLEGYWDVVMSSEDCGYLKPHPAPFLALAEALDCKPEEIIYVGNNYAYDVCGACGVGMKAVHVNWMGKTAAPADAVIRNYQHFLDKIDFLLGES